MAGRLNIVSGLFGAVGAAVGAIYPAYAAALMGQGNTGIVSAAVVGMMIGAAIGVFLGNMIFRLVLVAAIAAAVVFREPIWSAIVETAQGYS